jgi:serine/threonine-protein kinase
MTPMEGETHGDGPYGPDEGDRRDGTSLQALLDRFDSLPPGAALVLLDDMLEELEHSASGRTSRIDPTRLTVDEGGRFHVTPSASYSREAAGSGSLRYAAPELRDGGLATPASDIYAAAALFYAAATGLPPQAAAAGDSRPGAPAHEGPLPEALVTLTDQALAADPAARPSVGVFRARLGMAAEAALHEWQSRGRTWLSGAVATLQPREPDAAPPRIDWSEYGRAPGTGAESVGVLGMRPRVSVMAGFGIFFTGLLMVVIGVTSLGGAPPRSGVSAAAQQTVTARPTPAATTAPGFAVPAQPFPTPAEAAQPSPSATAAPPPSLPPPTALPTFDMSSFTPYPVPTVGPTYQPGPTPSPNCFIICPG